MKETKTVLIFGISSFVGSNLAEFLKDEYRVIGTYFSKPVEIPGVLTVKVDVLNKDQAQLIIQKFRPDYTIYAVGMTSVQDCFENTNESEALNGSGIFNIAEYAQKYKSQLVHISSALVFSGEKESYLEKDNLNPTTDYG
ncbi:sugar nucleotide-binding protein, partial [bacterium]|nr:sugar nucleotide-binding protein [bacterium]